MTLGLFFWILMLIWFVSGFWTPPDQPWWPTARNILLFLLLLALGWAQFGPPIRG